MSNIGIIKEDENNIFVCKYHLPCGWCELKNKLCGQYFGMMYPRNAESSVEDEYYNLLKEKVEKMFVWSGTRGENNE